MLQQRGWSGVLGWEQPRCGTAVLLADGTLEDIEDVELGDLVWARDPETGEVGARPVSALIEGSGLKELVDVEVDGETIAATDEHPFWVDDEGRWIDAEDLQVGDLLLLADGTTTEVDGVWHHTQILTVHNLTVEGIHTYHVALGTEAALVHNCAESFPASSDEMTEQLGIEPSFRGVTPDGTERVRWEPNERTRITMESHPAGLTADDAGFNPRHHDVHFHVQIRPNGSVGWNNPAVFKVEPPGYTPGAGTGFRPGEPFPS